MSDNLTQYGNDNAPFALYQAPDGKWGLINKDGNHLPAVFDRYEGDRLSSVPWEVVTFSEQDGFELLAWYDPCEVWFNFTWENEAYPPRWAKMLWSKTGRFSDYRSLYLTLLPKYSRWLIDAIVMYKTLYRLIDYKDWKREDHEDQLLRQELLKRYPDLNDIAASNLLLAPVLDNPEVEQHAKATLWHDKVALDNFLFIESDEE